MSQPVDAFTAILHPEVSGYLDTMGPVDPLLDSLEAYGAQRQFPLVGRLSGAWLEILTIAIGGRRVFEFGSGFGYSAYFFARAIGEEGRVVGAERDAWELEAHRKLYDGHPLASRIHIHHGEAETVFQSSGGSWDVVFFDCDKAAYARTLELCADSIRPGGLLLADNVLWGGKVAREADEEDASTLGLQDFNRVLAADPRFDYRILPVGDGLGVALKLS